MVRLPLLLWPLLAGLSLASTATVVTQPIIPIQCETERAPDYYGLGVRLGIYFSWLQGYIANTMLPSEIAGALDANTIFLLTLLVAMIKCSRVRMLKQIDGLVLMHLSGGTIFGVLSIWGYRTVQYSEEGPKAIRHFGGYGTHVRLIVSLAISVFGLWFWMWGIVGGLEPIDDTPECGTVYTFFFGKLRADGGMRYFYIVICIGCIVYFGIMLLASSLAGYAKVDKMIRLARSNRWADTAKLRFATGFKYKELHYIFQFLQWANLLWLMYSVLLVEMTLRYNHVTAVLGGPNDNELHLPSELLPLLIGAFGFIRTCWLKFEEWRSPSNPDPSIAQDPAAPHRSRTMRFGVRMLQAFSESLEADAARKEEHEAAELDELERGRSRGVRYLVAYLPWLSLLGPWRNDAKHGEDKALPTSRAKSVRVAEKHVVPETEVEASGKRVADEEEIMLKKR